MNHLRFAVRSFLKTPGFTIAILLTLALGIGANIGLFSVINATLLRPLPYPDSARLVELIEQNKDGFGMSVAYPNFVDWKERQGCFAQLALFHASASDLAIDGVTQRVQAGYVDADFFRTLGVNLVLGRNFTREDDRSASPIVVLLTHESWQKRFGADPAIVGRRLVFAGHEATVVGVLPENFRFYREMELYVTLAPFVAELYMTDRQNHNDAAGIGRLRDGVTLAQAREEMSAIAKHIEEANPKTNAGIGVRLQPLQERVSGRVRSSLLLLFGAVGMVLLIACVNVANMLLSKASARGREMAIRTALGAGRRDLIQQLLTESLLLAVVGSLAGLMVGQWLFGAFGALIPYEQQMLGAALANPFMDWRVILFVVGITLFTGIGFGLFPALQLTRAMPAEALKERSGTGAHAPGRLRVSDGLVVAEVALATMLLIGAGLMIRNLHNLKSTSLGFDSDRLVTLKIASPNLRMGGVTESVVNFYEQAAEALRKLPGVESVGITNRVPYDFSDSTMIFHLRDAPLPEPGRFPATSVRSVDPEFFRAMGIRPVQGSLFTREKALIPIPSGKPDMPAILAALREHSMKGVVSQSFARRHWPDSSAVGKVIRLGIPEAAYGWVEIVGVVPDIRLQSVEQEYFDELYLPFRQWAVPVDFGLVVRVSGDPEGMLSTIRDAVQAYAPQDPVYALRVQRVQVEQSLSDRSFNSLLLGFFALLAVGLSLVGIYGVITFAINQRTREIGVRMALGASAEQVLRQVLLRGLTLIVPGILLGLLGAWALSRWLQSQLHGLKATDPSTYVLTALILLGSALAACWLPARRATRIDPVEALRSE
jgi:predicted permease